MIVALTIIILGFVIAYGFMFYKYKQVADKKYVTNSDIVTREILSVMFPLMVIFQMFLIVIPFGAHDKDFIVLPRMLWLVLFGLYCLSRSVKSLTGTVFRAKDVIYDSTYCLYLRSFNADKERKEENLLSYVKHYFRVFAIGDPNTIINTNSFSRVFATDAEWKDDVVSLMLRSEIIFIRVGDTMGTIWELEKIKHSKFIDKTVFCIYTYDEYLLFCSKFGNLNIANNVDLSKGLLVYLKDNEWKIKKIDNNNDYKLFIHEYVNSDERLGNRCFKKIFRNWLGTYLYGLWPTLTSDEKYRYVSFFYLVYLSFLICYLFWIFLWRI